MSQSHNDFSLYSPLTSRGASSHGSPSGARGKAVQQVNEPLTSDTNPHYLLPFSAYRHRHVIMKLTALQAIPLNEGT